MLLLVLFAAVMLWDVLLQILYVELKKCYLLKLFVLLTEIKKNLKKSEFLIFIEGFSYVSILKCLTKALTSASANKNRCVGSNMEGIRQPETRKYVLSTMIFFYLMKELILVLRAIDGICMCGYYGEKYWIGKLMWHIFIDF